MTYINAFTTRSILFVSCIFLFPGQAHAYGELEPGFGGIAYTGLALGGDDLVDTTAEDLQAGGLIYGQIGITYQFDTPLLLQATIGYKFDTVDYVGGESTISSIPVDLLAFYLFEKYRIGAGLAIHHNPEWEFCLFGCAPTIHFDDAIGITIEIDKELRGNAFIGGRFTIIDYEFRNISVDANHVGVHVGLRF